MRSVACFVAMIARAMFEGASPRIMSEVYQSLQLARLVYRRAAELKLVEM